MKQIFTIFFLAVLSVNVYAQFPCGIDHDDIEEITVRLKEHKETIAKGFLSKRSGAIIYLPVKFHIISKTNGFGGVSEVFVLQQLDLLNENYQDQEIQFYIDNGFNYINNTGAFENPSSPAGNLALRQNRVNGRINIFIPRTAMTGGGSIGTTLGFYSPFRDWIVIRQQEVIRLTSTLTHELGHFLSLLHPHSGWDSVVYNPAEHTPTPEFSPSGRETENEARSGNCKNCDDAGDFLCDTPPDYNFGFGWNDCDYDRGTLDPCGELVDVQEGNYMSYFGDCNDYIFTPQQKQLMEVDVAARKADNSLFGNLAPDTVEPVEGDVVAISPTNGGLSPGSQSAFINWEPVEGATDYIFEYNRSILGFATATRIFISGSQNEILINEPLIPNTEYQWRIYPYNQTSTGYGFSETFTFRTGSLTSVSVIDEVNSFEIYPNLVSNQNEVMLDVNSNQSIALDIQLLDISGKLISQKSTTLVSGQNNIDLSVSNLNNGIYFVKLESKSGIITKKLIIQNN